MALNPNPNFEPSMPVSLKDDSHSTSMHVVAIAMGSNMGDRCAFIEKALRELERRRDVITIAETSFLYESKPMYVEDQNKFLNCAIKVGNSAVTLIQ
jgi:dihydroneopterin aldolase / 2-amino-4-hydroxy-6-hydroxymethyldihydropteridine diphosphokinase / dihydropteroate synthase